MRGSTVQINSINELQLISICDKKTFQCHLQPTPNTNSRIQQVHSRPRLLLIFCSPMVDTCRMLSSMLFVNRLNRSI